MALIPALLALVAILFGASGVFAYSQLRADSDKASKQLAAFTAQEKVTAKRMANLTDTNRALALRVSAAESRLNQHPDTAEIARQARRSVFTIAAGRATGSGFVVTSRDGRAQLVTNFHVVADIYVNGGVKVSVRRGRVSYDGTIVDVSEANDLAVIEVDVTLPTLQLVRKRPAVGDSVLALGSPLGLGGTVTSGIVSAFRTTEGVEYMQFSAPISPGNSGGPVINADGDVVAVTVQKMFGEGAEGLGFAIPADRLCDALKVC